MPPHLHPRSRLTSSLFATTLFASFFVVALPHALPCPAPRGAWADEVDGAEAGGEERDADADADGLRRRRRRRRRVCAVGEEGEGERGGKGVRLGGVEGDVQPGLIPREKKTLRRECPVPKPGGLVGEILGLKKKADEDEKGRPP